MANKPKQNIISIDNFQRMSPEVPQFSEQNKNYLIQNADPFYYLAENTQEEQVAPLAAAGYWNWQVNGTDFIDQTSRRVFDMIDGGGSGWDVIIAVDDWTVHGMGNKASKSLYGTSPGTPITSGTPDGSGRLALFNQSIVWSCSKGEIWYTPFGGSSWTMALSGLGSGMVHYLEPFLDYVVTCDGSAVKTIDDTWNFTPIGFDLGVGWSILGFKNFNNKYLAIVATQNEGTVANNYLLLWDGTSESFNYSVKIPGFFEGMTVDANGVLYLLVREKNGAVGDQDALYYLSGTVLRRVKSIACDYVAVLPWNGAGIGGYICQNLFTYGGLLGVTLANKGLLLTGGIDAGEVEYIIGNPSYLHSSSTLYPLKAVSAGLGTLYVALGNYGSGAYTGIQFYVPFSSGITYGVVNNINYQSQWIPAKGLSGIDIWYETVPQVSGDAINITVYGQGENLITNGNQTIVCDPITYTHFDNQKRTRIDLRDKTTGEQFAGDQVMIKLTTTIGSGSYWRPIIRKINLIF